MQNTHELKAAMILRTWHNAAKATLKADDRLCLYDMICSYAFGDELPRTNSPAVIAMWELIRPAIDSDREKYSARCERNARNAASRSQSLPVATSGNQSQPNTIPNTIPNTTPISNTTPTPNTSSSTNEEREKFDCMGIFLSRGACDVVSECRAFWLYYSALGWKNNKGADIKNKRSAAAMWSIKGDTTAEPGGADLYYRCFRDVSTYKWEIWTAFRGLRVVANELHINFLGRLDLNVILESDYRNELQKLMGYTKTDTLIWHPVQA